jgi:hypothetical protein
MIMAINKEHKPRSATERRIEKAKKERIEDQILDSIDEKKLKKQLKIDEALAKAQKVLKKQTHVDDNTSKNLAIGITDYLMSLENKSLLLDKDRLTESIVIYLDSLTDLPVVYSRNQMINDLILLLKNGNSSCATILADLLNFRDVTSEYKLNMINYKDIKPVENI